MQRCQVEVPASTMRVAHFRALDEPVNTDEPEMCPKHAHKTTVRAGGSAKCDKTAPCYNTVYTAKLVVCASGIISLLYSCSCCY